MSSLSELWASPYQLWLVLGMKFLEGVSFFSLMYILVKYLSDDLGFSDVEAGWIFAFCNGLQFPFALCLSFFLDAWGVSRTSIVGESLLIIARLMLWLMHSRMAVYVALLMLYPMGTAALLPALIVGVKRFSTPQSRPYAFGIYYASQNAASLCAAGFVNLFRHRSEAGEFYIQLLCLGCITSAMGLLCNVFLYTSSQQEVADAELQEPAEGVLSKFEDTLRTFQSSTFWRFMAVIGSFIMIRMIFGHLKATFPKWMSREFGEDTPYELYVGANPALIIVLVPICTRMCELLQLKVQVALLIGAVISGFSPFILAFVVPSTLAVVVFIIVFSIGEAIWSPKLYEYTVAVPREGREGVYVACGSAPLYLAKFAAGAVSGYLLQQYCPQSDSTASDGGCHTRSLWFSIALSTSVTPVILLLFRRQLFSNSADDVTEDSTLIKKSDT